MSRRERMNRNRRTRIVASGLLATLVIGSACTTNENPPASTSSTARSELRPVPTVAETSPPTSTTIPTTTTTTIIPTTTVDPRAHARCIETLGGYRGVPIRLDDPSWTLDRRGEATYFFDGELVVEAALEFWLTRTVHGAHVEHRVTLRGRSVAAIAVVEDTVAILSADTSGLEREVTSTVDGEPVPTPDEFVGLGDLLGSGFTMRCGTGSGMMGADMLEPSGLEWTWAIHRTSRPPGPPNPDR